MKRLAKENNESLLSHCRVQQALCKKNIYSIALACGLILLAGCGGDKQQQEKSPIAVETMTVGESSVNGNQSFSGTIEEDEGVTVSFATSGTLTSLNIREGQTISKGQLIGVVDATTARSTYESSKASIESAKAGIESAKAGLETAQDNYNRCKMLHDRNSLAEQKWVQAQSQLTQARERVHQAQEQLSQARSMQQIAGKNLSDNRLYAPVSGYISEKDVESGQNIMQGQPICKIVSINSVKVKIAVPETEVTKIKQGQTIEFTVSALPGRVFRGQVVEKAVSADAMSRSYEVKALVQNADHALLPGMVADVKANMGMPANQSKVSDQVAIFLHADVVQLDSDNRNFVWTVVNGRAHKTYITTGEETSQGVMVTGGLNPGAVVIVKGQQKVSESNKVSVKG